MLCQEGVETFKAYCGASPDMSTKSFSKLCKDCKLIDKRLTAGDVDLIFARLVPKGQRRMDLRLFEDALRLVAEKKGVPVCDVCRAIEESRGPILNVTNPQPVRFHDDRSLYTGTHVYGGPRSGPKGNGTSINAAWLSTLRNEPGKESEKPEKSASTARIHGGSLHSSPISLDASTVSLLEHVQAWPEQVNGRRVEVQTTSMPASGTCTVRSAVSSRMSSAAQSSPIARENSARMSSAAQSSPITRENSARSMQCSQSLDGSIATALDTYQPEPSHHMNGRSRVDPSTPTVVVLAGSGRMVVPTTRAPAGTHSVPVPRDGNGRNSQTTQAPLEASTATLLGEPVPENVNVNGARGYPASRQSAGAHSVPVPRDNGTSDMGSRVSLASSDGGQQTPIVEAWPRVDQSSPHTPAQRRVDSPQGRSPPRRVDSPGSQTRSSHRRVDSPGAHAGRSSKRVDSPGCSGNRGGHATPTPPEPPPRQAIVDGWANTALLEESFKVYCAGHSTMDGMNFQRVCKHAGFIDKNFAATEADLIFTKVLPKGCRRIDYQWFQHALWHVAEKKGVHVEAIRAAIAALGPTGRVLNATKTEKVRFHDDKSTYTGVHNNGGPDVGPTVKVSVDEVWLAGLRHDDNATGALIRGRSGPRTSEPRVRRSTEEAFCDLRPSPVARKTWPNAWRQSV